MADGDAPQKLLMGRIGAAHGIKGEVRIQSYTEDPMALAGYGPLATNRPGLTITITTARANGSTLIARLDGIGDRNAAEGLNGVELYVDRKLLPQPEDEDEFYHADLIGLRAQLRDGTTLGEVVALPNFGAGDLIEIRDPLSGDSFLYPFTLQVVPEVHLSQGYLVIEVPVDAEPGEEEPE